LMWLWCACVIHWFLPSWSYVFWASIDRSEYLRRSIHESIHPSRCLSTRLPVCLATYYCCTHTLLHTPRHATQLASYTGRDGCLLTEGGGGAGLSTHTHMYLLCS